MRRLLRGGRESCRCATGPLPQARKQLCAAWLKYQAAGKPREAGREAIRSLAAKHPSGLACQALAKVAFMEGVRAALQVR